MGGSSWDDDDIRSRAATRASQGQQPMQHSQNVQAKIASGQTVTAADALHANLNIYGKRREARDSPAHPNSVPILVVFDETGSMADIPPNVQKQLIKLMAFLLGKGYIEDPQICIGAVGDAGANEIAPLQIGQFESGAEIDDDINLIYLEGNGGGNSSPVSDEIQRLMFPDHFVRPGITPPRPYLPRESYQNVIYYAANCIDTDAFQKRGKKGYLIIVGDECAYDRVSKENVKRLMGIDIESDMSTVDVIRACQEKWQIFYVIPNGSNHYNDDNVRLFWSSLLGKENVIKLDKIEAVCETIGQIIGLCEDTLDPKDMAAHLHDLGSSHVAGAVLKGLSTLADSRALARVGTGSLPEATSRSTGTTRL